MEQTRKTRKSAGRGERHSAAWGKRLSTLLLLLIAQTAFAEHGHAARRTCGQFAPELAAVAAQARPHTAASQTIRVIVQYKQAPLSEQVSRMQRLGGRVSTRLSLVKGIALTIPVSALAGLEADPDVLFVSIDHPLQKLDDQTDTPPNVRSPLAAGFDGTRIGGAIVENGGKPT